MSIDDIIAEVVAMGGILTLRPQPGDGSPEISWGDVFFYYAPDGEIPKVQPFATIVTKDYPDDDVSRLDRPSSDVLFPHPVYGRLGWRAVVNPGAATAARVLELLTSAHHAARDGYRG